MRQDQGLSLASEPTRFPRWPPLDRKGRRKAGPPLKLSVAHSDPGPTHPAAPGSSLSAVTLTTSIPVRTE